MAVPWLIIVNPAAGSGRASRQWPAIATRLRKAGIEHEVAFTRQPGDATSFCRSGLRAGVSTVVAAGGDGTVNEVVNGFFDAEQGDQTIAPRSRLGLLPLGTGSDLARSFAIRRGAHALATLTDGCTTPIDIGQITIGSTSRYFANVADLGLGAETAARVNHAPKWIGGFGAYLIGAIRAILAYQPQQVSLRLDDDAPIEESMGIVVVANNRYFGGGMHVAPRAVPDDGRLDVLWLAATSRRRLLCDLLPRLYRGAHLGHPAVQWRQARTVAVSSTGRMLVEADGEQIGAAPATVRVLPQALELVVPCAQANPSPARR